MITGSCHCGGISYEISSQAQHSFVCHCDSCQKINGGMRLAAEIFSEDSLSVSGDVKKYVYRGGEGEIHMHFCPECGTHVYALPTLYPGMAVVRTGTLDDTESFTPGEEMFSDNKCPWENK